MLEPETQEEILDLLESPVKDLIKPRQLYILEERLKGRTFRSLSEELGVSAMFVRTLQFQAIERMHSWNRAAPYREMVEKRKKRLAI